MDTLKFMQCASAAVVMLRVLESTDDTMTHQLFGRSIGLIEDGEKWTPRHRSVISRILHLLGDQDRWCNGGENKLQLHRVVDAANGNPGSGLERPHRLRPL